MEWTSPPPSKEQTGRDAAPFLNPVLSARLALLARSAQGNPLIWWSALLDLRDTSLAELRANLNERLLGSVVIPVVYDARDIAARPDRQRVTLFLRSAALAELNSNPAAYGVAWIADGAILDDAAINPEAPPLPPPAPVGVPVGSVVMAVIDDGIAIAHDLFRDGPTSSRVHHAWVMSAGPQSQGRPMTMGRAIEKPLLDSLLASFTHNGLLDEAALYRATGQIDFGDGQFSPVALRRSHGTHVAATAAGHPMGDALQTRPIICATLPPQVTQDVTGQSALPALALALQDLSRQASRFVIAATGEPAPVVLNFSFGNYSGPHDGTGEYATLFEQFVNADPAQSRRVVLPAGYGNLLQTHAELRFEPAPGGAEPRALHLQVLPDDRTASYVQLWMPRVAAGPQPDFVTVSVTPPGGQPSPPLHTDGITGPLFHELRDDAGQIIGQISYTLAPDPVGRGLVTLALNPTASLLPGAALAPAGLWQITVTPVAIQPPAPAAAASPPHLPPRTVQVWVRRDETLPGFAPGGRQAWLRDPAYRRFDALGRPLATDPPGTAALVRRAGTLSGYATSATPLVAGAATAQGRSVSPYSASGPLTPFSPAGTPPQVTRSGPDLVARADDSPVLPGIISAGSASGSFLRQSGTSVAAPAIARQLADGLPVPVPFVPPDPTRAGEGYCPVTLRLLDLPVDILAPHGP